MALFDKLKNMVRGEEPVATEIAALRKERRYNERHSLAGTSLVQITCADATLTVADISYGGISVRLDDRVRSVLTVGAKFDTTVTVPGQTTSIPIEVVRHGPGRGDSEIAGVKFHHESRESLSALRNIIEPLRLGGTLVPVDTANLKEEKQIANIRYMRGEGPIDLNFADNYFYMLFPIGQGEYGEVRLYDGKLMTAKTQAADVQRFAGQMMSNSQDLDEQLITTAALILTGAMSQHAELVSPILVTFLGKYSESNGALESA